MTHDPLTQEKTQPAAQPAHHAANAHHDKRHTAELLRVEALQTHFYTNDGVVHAVDGVSFTLHKGETLGIVGESGCGKSVTSLSIMRLIDTPGKIIAGRVLFDGVDLLTVSSEEMRNLRGNRSAMIFQQPTTYLNPVFSVGYQITETLKIHQGMDTGQARQRTIELLTMVGLPDPQQRVRQYPHQLSGGQCQRVMIAMALACNPELLIADEPTTALDVTIQAQILDLMHDLRQRTGTSIILITHDMGIVAEMADSVAVMYAGEIVEYADVVSIFRDPKHPYTQGLLSSIPMLGQVQDELSVIPGVVPSLVNPPPGCRFANRCPHYFSRCDDSPPMLALEGERQVRCWLYDEDAQKRNQNGEHDRTHDANQNRDQDEQS